MITELNATPLIGRCPGFGPRSGGCRTAVHLDGTYRDGQPALEIVWCPPAGTPMDANGTRTQVLDVGTASRWELTPHCIEHRWPVRFARIKVVHTDERCGPDCRKATGTICRCSCDGYNHGADA